MTVGLAEVEVVPFPKSQYQLLTAPFEDVEVLTTVAVVPAQALEGIPVKERDGIG